MPGIKGRSGRQKNERVIKHFLREILDEIDPTTGRKRIAQICRTLVKEAAAGKIEFIREMFDRLEGKALQGHLHGEDPDNPFATARDWSDEELEAYLGDRSGSGASAKAKGPQKPH